MKIPSPRSGRVLLGAATILAVVAAGMQRGQVVLAVASAQTTIDGSSNLSVQSKQELRRQAEKKEFIREHSDASGKLRPDLWHKGVQDQQKMQVAPYIGWHPSSAASPTAAK